MATSKKLPKQVFDESRQQFREAHSEGIKKLRDHDLSGLGEAIDKERDAIDKAASSIEAVASAAVKSDETAAVPSPKHAPRGDEQSRAIQAEHERLLNEVDALEREHRALEDHPHDLQAHREHRERLQKQVAELRAHLRRLRGETNHE